jgi:hypothetical protein
MAMRGTAPCPPRASLPNIGGAGVAPQPRVMRAGVAPRGHGTRSSNKTRGRMHARRTATKNSND